MVGFVLWWWWWRAAIPGGAREFVLDIFEQLEPNLFIPFWVLASALNGFGPSSLIGELEDTIRILLANMPLVRKVFL